MKTHRSLVTNFASEIRCRFFLASSGHLAKRRNNLVGSQIVLLPNFLRYSARIFTSVIHRRNSTFHEHLKDFKQPNVITTELARWLVSTEIRRRSACPLGHRYNRENTAVFCFGCDQSTLLQRWTNTIAQNWWKISTKVDPGFKCVKPPPWPLTRSHTHVFVLASDSIKYNLRPRKTNSSSFLLKTAILCVGFLAPSMKIALHYETGH